MPYIRPVDRDRLSFTDEAENAGELNFQITNLIWSYWRRNGQNYQAFNDIIGALEGAKLEIYRRKIAPYEDTKIEQNGDCYA